MNRPIPYAIALVWVVFTWGCGDSSSPNGPATHDGGGSQVTSDSLFADRGLEVAVRAALGRPEGSIGQEELSSLKDLDAHGLGIKDMGGIGQLDSLQSLDLAENELTDLSPLASLTRLEYLDLSNNHLTEVSALASLAQLKVLVLEQNAVEDLSPLQGLSHLERLELTKGMVATSATAGLAARGCEVVWAMAGESPSSGGVVTGPAIGAGPRIAFAASKVGGQDMDIWVMSPDGSGLTPLIYSTAREMDPAWSPDGIQLAFAKQVGSSRDIYAIRSKDKNPIGLAQERGRDEHSPSWSPDGSRIAYVRDHDIWVMQADGSGQVKLTQHPDDDNEPSWSPDGQRIVFSSARDRHDLRGNYDIFVMNPDGGSVERLTQLSSTSCSPSFSPDGTQIAFCSNRDRGGNYSPTYDVFVMGADGSNPMNLTGPWHIEIPPSSEHTSWSPDGLSILCTTGRTIWSIALDGSNPTKLLVRDSCSSPVWTADAAMDLAGLEEQPPRFFANADLERVVLAQLVGVTPEEATETDLLAVTAVSCRDCGIRDLTGIEKLRSLRVLVLTNGKKDSTAVPDETWNLIGDLSPLAGLQELQRLSLALGPQADLSPLAQLGQLTSLELTGDGIEDLAPLARLLDLKELSLTSNRLQDLRPLSELKALTQLSLTGSHISDLAPLATLSGLVNLLVNEGQVHDLTPLSNLTHLARLDLYKNQVEELSALSGMSSLLELFIWSNQVREITPLLALPLLRTVGLGDNPLSEKAREIDIPALRDRGVDVRY